MTKYNKYEIYVDKTELATYIEKIGIKDKYIFEEGKRDFLYVEEDDDQVNFFSSIYNAIDGVEKEYIFEQIRHPIKVSAEEFLIAIDYLEEDRPKTQTTEKIKVEDVHYLDSLYPSDTDCLWLSEDPEGDVYLNTLEGSSMNSIILSPESLISLGKDLIQIGVSKQIEEESNED